MTETNGSGQRKAKFPLIICLGAQFGWTRCLDADDVKIALKVRPFIHHLAHRSVKFGSTKGMIARLSIFPYAVHGPCFLVLFV